MNCSDLKEYLLYGYVDGGLLAPTESELVRLHLVDCAECRHEEKILRSLLWELSPPFMSQTSEKKNLWPAVSACLTNCDPFVALLAESLAKRQISTATHLVVRNIDRISQLEPTEKNAAVLLSYFAQWMHITGSANIEGAGYSNLILLKSTYRKFPEIRRHLDLVSCVHLRRVAGLIALHTERYDAAVRHFQFVLAAEPDLSGSDGSGEEADLISVVNHAVGHAYRRKGEYADGLRYTERAIEIAARRQRKEMVAAFSVSKGWLLFRLNRPVEAEELFLKAEPVLQECGDFLSVGNLKAALGKIRQREGLIKEALDLQLLAIENFAKCDHRHKNIARSLVSIAFLQRLLSLVAMSHIRGRDAVAGIETLRHSALKNLEKADDIYDSHQDYRGRGSSRLVRAFIQMDEGNYSGAKAKGAEAYKLGCENRDYVLMARALILMCRLENIGQAEHVSGDSPELERARRLASDAVDAAERTQDSRLIAHSHIWLGLTLLNAFPPDLDSARTCYHGARALLQPHTPIDPYGEMERSLLRHDFLENETHFKPAAAFRRRRIGAVDWIVDELALLRKKLTAAEKACKSAHSLQSPILKFSEVSDARTE